MVYKEFEILNGNALESADGISLSDTLRALRWSNPSRALDIRSRKNATHFGFVSQGMVQLDTESGGFQLSAGMYFAIPGALTITPWAPTEASAKPAASHLTSQNNDRQENLGFVVSMENYRSFPHLGGPIESTGRLRYIDGCSDSLLVPPVMLGDPCLNLLHLPPGVRQSFHTHPSLRLGMIVRGAGWCLTADRRTALLPGQLFFIPPDSVHCFHTEDESLLIIAFHPDSDFGPTHENHPMINRTILTPLAEH